LLEARNPDLNSDAHISVDSRARDQILKGIISLPRLSGNVINKVETRHLDCRSSAACHFSRSRSKMLAEYSLSPTFDRRMQIA